MTDAIVEGIPVPTGHWIGGQRVGGADAFEDISPIDEQVIAGVARGGPAEVDAEVARGGRVTEAAPTGSIGP